MTAQAAHNQTGVWGDTMNKEPAAPPKPAMFSNTNCFQTFSTALLSPT